MTSFTLLLVVLACIRTQLLYAIPSRLALIAFRYTQPILLEVAIDFMNDQTRNSTESSNGHLIICGTAFVYIGMAVSVCFRII